LHLQHATICIGMVVHLRHGTYIIHCAMCDVQPLGYTKMVLASCPGSCSYQVTELQSLSKMVRCLGACSRSQMLQPPDVNYITSYYVDYTISYYYHIILYHKSTHGQSPHLLVSSRAQCP
jgi:hypothetical protein